MSVDYKKAAQVQQRATANQSTKYAGASSQPRVATGKPANPGVQGQRSSNPQYNNPYNTRNEQQRLEEKRFQQGRRDALRQTERNRNNDQRQQTFENNYRKRDQNARLQQQSADNSFRRQGFNADQSQQESDNAYRDRALSLDYSSRNADRAVNRETALADTFSQLAAAKGNQSVQREQIMAGLVGERWRADNERQRNWLDGFANLNTSYSSGQNYRYWS